MSEFFQYLKILEGKENKIKGIENLFNEIIAEKLSNLGKDMSIHVQEA
jgi:hypothetical protein